MAYVAQPYVIRGVESGLGAQIPVGEAAERALDDPETLAPRGLARHGGRQPTLFVGCQAPS
jgi:hypothetical protein